jgi:hypothetical protein
MSPKARGDSTPVRVMELCKYRASGKRSSCRNVGRRPAWLPLTRSQLHGAMQRRCKCRGTGASASGRPAAMDRDGSPARSSMRGARRPVGRRRPQRCRLWTALSAMGDRVICFYFTCLACARLNSCNSPDRRLTYVCQVPHSAQATKRFSFQHIAAVPARPPHSGTALASAAVAPRAERDRRRHLAGRL